MLLILNLPLVSFFARIATVKPNVLMPIISLLCLIGVYAVRNSFVDVWVMIISGVIGYFFLKWKYPVGPLVIGLILGPMLETNLIQSLAMFKGNLYLFLGRPIAMAFFSVSLIYILYRVLAVVKAMRNIK
jgi:putative tricarboxylic transport membrane protein